MKVKNRLTIDGAVVAGRLIIPEEVTHLREPRGLFALRSLEEVGEEFVALIT